jgi:hypothetical protein
MGLPIYWRNHIYNEKEREKLWIEKLDKNERWVMGQKIDISETDQEYYKAMYSARIKNQRLGYGNNESNWEQKEYENNRRNLKKMLTMNKRRKKKKKVQQQQIVKFSRMDSINLMEEKEVKLNYKII